MCELNKMTADVLKQRLEDTSSEPLERQVSIVVSNMSQLIDAMASLTERFNAVLDDMKSNRARMEGAAMMWRILRYVAVFGGGSGASILYQILSSKGT